MTVAHSLMGLTVALDIGWGMLSPAKRAALSSKVCTETEQLMDRVRYSELVSGSLNSKGRFKLTDNGTWWARAYIQNHVSTSAPTGFVHHCPPNAVNIETVKRCRVLI